MLKGLLLTDARVIVKILEGIMKINKEEKTISCVSTKLGGVNFDMLNIVVTDSTEDFKAGDVLPDGFVDLSYMIENKPVNDLVNRLGEEIKKLKLELKSIKGDV